MGVPYCRRVLFKNVGEDGEDRVALLYDSRVACHRGWGGCFLLFVAVEERHTLLREFKEVAPCVEVVLIHHTYALCGEGGAHGIVAVVEVVVGLESQVAILGEQVFDIEVANEVGRAILAVAIAEVAVDNKAVIEQLARQE